MKRKSIKRGTCIAALLMCLGIESSVQAQGIGPNVDGEMALGNALLPYSISPGADLKDLGTLLKDEKWDKIWDLAGKIQFTASPSSFNDSTKPAPDGGAILVSFADTDGVPSDYGYVILSAAAHPSNDQSKPSSVQPRLWPLVGEKEQHVSAGWPEAAVPCLAVSIQTQQTDTSNPTQMSLLLSAVSEDGVEICKKGAVNSTSTQVCCLDLNQPLLDQVAGLSKLNPIGNGQGVKAVAQRYRKDKTGISEMEIQVYREGQIYTQDVILSPENTGSENNTGAGSVPSGRAPIDQPGHNASGGEPSHFGSDTGNSEGGDRNNMEDGQREGRLFPEVSSFEKGHAFKGNQEIGDSKKISPEIREGKLERALLQYK